MLHLSLITLARSSARWQFLQPYRLHQWLWQAFSDVDTRESRFLYRHNDTRDEHSVLVQSAVEPNWSAISSGSDCDIKQKTMNVEDLGTNMQLRFFLRANPVVSRKYGDGKTRRIAVGSDRKRQVELLDKPLEDIPSRERQLVDWLERQGDRCGFAIARGTDDRVLCDPGPNRDLRFRKTHAGKEQDHITITTVDFSGVLRVTDSDAFARSIEHGIGRARAFGCGLLSIASIG